MWQTKSTKYFWYIYFLVNVKVRKCMHILLWIIIDVFSQRLQTFFILLRRFKRLLNGLLLDRELKTHLADVLFVLIFFLVLLVVGTTFCIKCLGLRRFKSDQNEIWQDCSSILIDWPSSIFAVTSYFQDGGHDVISHRKVFATWWVHMQRLPGARCVPRLPLSILCTVPDP